MSTNDHPTILIFSFRKLVILDTIKVSLSSKIKIQLDEKAILLHCQGDSNNDIHQFSYKKLKIIDGNSDDSRVLQSDGLKLEYTYSINKIASDNLLDMITRKNAIIPNVKNKRGRSSLTPTDTLRKPPRTDATMTTPSIKNIANFKNTLFMNSNSPIKTSGVVSRRTDSLEESMHRNSESKFKQYSSSPMNSRSSTTLIDRPPLNTLPSSKSGVAAAKICDTLSLLATTPVHTDSSPLTPPSRTSNLMTYTQKPLSQCHKAAKHLQYKSTRLEFILKDKPRSSAAVFDSMRFNNEDLNDTSFFHDDRMLVDQNVPKQPPSSSKEANSHIGTGSPPRFRPQAPSVLSRPIWRDFPRSRDSTNFSSSLSPREVDTGLGLRNLGNSCYMSAVLQALRSLEGLVEDMRSPLWSSVAATVQQKQTSCFVQFARICGVADRRASDLSALKLAVDTHSQLFRGYRQHDAHEFLCDLLQLLSEEMQSSLSRLLRPQSTGSCDMTVASDPNNDKENRRPFLNSILDSNSTNSTVGTKTTRKPLAQDNKNHDSRSSTSNTTTSTEGSAPLLSTAWWSEEEVQLRLPPRRRFHAEVVTRLRCCHCNHRRVKKELYRDFSLDLTIEESTTATAVSPPSSTSFSSTNNNNHSNPTNCMTGTPRSSSIVHIVTPESSGSIFTDLATTSTGHRSWKEREKERERDGKEEQGASDPSGLGNGRQMSWLPSPLSTPPPPLHSSMDLTMLTSSPPPQRSDSSSWPPANPPPAFSSSYRPPPTPTLQHSKALQLEDLLSSFFRPEICSLQCDECHSGEEGMAEVTPELYGLPDVLILHLKRFRFDERSNKFSKCNVPVTFPLQLTVHPSILHKRSGESAEGSNDELEYRKKCHRQAQGRGDGGADCRDDMHVGKWAASAEVEVEAETETEIFGPMLGVDLRDTSGLLLDERSGGAGSTVPTSTDLTTTTSQQIERGAEEESSAPLTLSQTEEKDLQEALRLSLLGSHVDSGSGADSRWPGEDEQWKGVPGRTAMHPSATDSVDAREGDSWTCLGCTFINSDPAATHCLICETSRKLEERPVSHQQPQPPPCASSDIYSSSVHDHPWGNAGDRGDSSGGKKRVKVDHPLPPPSPYRLRLLESRSSSSSTPSPIGTSTSANCCYTLKAVVRHLGSESSGGHYICDILQPSPPLARPSDSMPPEGNMGQYQTTNPPPPLWRRCDDSMISYITEAQLLSEKSSPYIFFYSMNK